MGDRSNFPSRLRWWRERRGVSQLDLSLTAGVSQRHLSFIEIGRSAPSRDMVLRLSAALDLPLREQNALLLAAGFAPIWRETALGAPVLSIVDRALTFILAQQEPYPAFVLDRRWKLLRANRAGRVFIGFLTDTPPQEPDANRPINLADALVAPDALRPLLRNWREVALYFVRGVRADALADGSAATAALLDRLMHYPDVPALSETSLAEKAAEPVLTMEIAKGGTSLSLFTTLTTLGTPLDVTAQEIRVECFFPADPDTARFFSEWAARGSG